MSRQQRREDERELKKREAKWKTMTPAQQCASMVRVVYAMAAQICKDWKTDAISLVTLYELTNKIKIDINALANAPEDDLKSAEGYNNVVAMMYLNWEDAAKERGSEFVPLALIKNNVEDVANGFIRGAESVKTVSDKGVVEVGKGGFGV